MWKCNGTEATLHSADLVGRVDLTRPQVGVGNVSVRWEDQAVELPNFKLLQVHLSPTATLERLSDSWVRGDDLVGSYSQTSHRDFAPDVYWRNLRGLPALCAGIELILSIHTSLLDAAPRATVRSELPACEVMSPTDGAFSAAKRLERGGSTTIAGERGVGLVLCRFESLPVSYVEMIFPSDFVAASCDWKDDTVVLQWQLFPESLEKGVIRRARLRGLFVPRDTDLTNAANLYREFAESALPLTT